MSQWFRSLLKVNNRNTRTKYEICSKTTIKTPERRWTYFTPSSSVSIVNFEHVIAGWSNRFAYKRFAVKIVVALSLELAIFKKSWTRLYRSSNFSQSWSFTKSSYRSSARFFVLKVINLSKASDCKKLFSGKLKKCINNKKSFYT